MVISFDYRWVICIYTPCAGDEHAGRLAAKTHAADFTRMADPDSHVLEIRGHAPEDGAGRATDNDLCLIMR